jgi:hypothetical protein
MAQVKPAIVEIEIRHGDVPVGLETAPGDHVAAI